MAVSSAGPRNSFNWSDEIGLLPLLLTLILPIVIGVIVLLKCVYNHCCLRKASTKSYTVKPTLKSWKDKEPEESRQYHEPGIAGNEGNETEEPSTSGSVRNSNTNPIVGSADEELSRENEVGDSRPIPPRRIGSNQWRRNSSQARAQQNSTNDNQMNFSGDSQDSRGYTRISVREPLSNIRAQAAQRNGDHYATASDDSEEMYAAIEDGDGNYMRIPADDGLHWHERREANSPLPPVPPPISPALISSSETPAAAASSGAATTDPIPIQPPIYAQVTKTKKTKAPIGPSLSNSSTSSSQARNTPSIPTDSKFEPSLPVSLPSNNSAVKKRPHHHASVLSDSAEALAEPRRWSKADINYAEFEIVREPPFPSTSKSNTIAAEIIDEDNYNMVLEVRTSTRTSSRRSEKSASIPSSRTLPHRLRDSHAYAVIKKPAPPLPTENDTDRNHGYSELTKKNAYAEDQEPHGYSELGKRSASRSPTGYYQEISDNKPTKMRDNLYQKIRRKGGEGPGEYSEEDDEDEEDQFYEKVKAKPVPAPALLPQNELPQHANPSALKHGYEKIKPKLTVDGVVALPQQINIPDLGNPVESDEDGSSLYEQVKYPPYERLKEAYGDEEDGSRDNLYEDIGYSRIKKSTTKSSQSEVSSCGASASASSTSPPLDVDNLYARVDMTKKKRNAPQTDGHASGSTGRLQY